MTTTRQFINLKFSKANSGKSERFVINALIMNKISQKLPLKIFDKNEKWVHINKLQLADPDYNIPANIDILLGGDIWNEIVMPGIRKKRGSPVAQRTKLGWILNGKIAKPNDTIACFTTITDVIDDSIEEQLKKFWQIEEISEKKELSDEERSCTEFYEKTTIRNPSELCP